MDRKIFFSSEIVEFGQFSGKTKLHWREKLLAVPHLATDLPGFPCTFKKMRFASKLRLMHSKTKVGNMPLFLDNLAPDNVTDFTADFRRCLQMLKSSTRLNSLAHCSSVVRPFIRKHTHTHNRKHTFFESKKRKTIVLSLIPKMCIDSNAFTLNFVVTFIQCSLDCTESENT